MILEIAEFDHPALRTRGRRIERVTDEIRVLAADMIDTMREAEGIGLAAQQVGRPLQMFVLEVPQMKNRPSVLRIGGSAVDIDAAMPMVLLNPEVTLSGAVASEVEGCLSFPGLLGQVPRPYSVSVRATGLDGEMVTFQADGLLARAVQHELDHLEGILFLDRAEDASRAEWPSDVLRLIRPLPSPGAGAKA